MGYKFIIHTFCFFFLKNLINKDFIIMVKFIYKICAISEWKRFKKNYFFYGTKKDLLDGYIHFSKRNQVKKTLARHYFKKDKLILLKIKTFKLKTLVWEKSKGGDIFPHLYTYLDLDSINKTYKIILKKNGYHIINKNF
jgi:uncharacterized protein (DUF952 family)